MKIARIKSSPCLRLKRLDDDSLQASQHRTQIKGKVGVSMFIYNPALEMVAYHARRKRGQLVHVDKEKNAAEPTCEKRIRH